MIDVIVAGAGPAGSIAALVLARAGARVLVIDRDAMPRDRLCGDLLNPGAVALLRDLGLDPAARPGAHRVSSLSFTGPFGSVAADYAPLAAVAVPRRDLDRWLLDAALQAGARFHAGDVVRAPLMDESGRWPRVHGVILRSRGARTDTRMPANMVIAADGRRSILARRLGLRVPGAGPRQWAVGAHVTNVAGDAATAGIHVGHGWSLGLTPLGGDLMRVWVSLPSRPDGRHAHDVIRDVMAHDAALRDRLAAARFDDGGVQVDGPLTMGVRTPGAPGLFLAGDAAGFVDPATADGLSLAIQGGRLAALEALTTLEDGEFASAIGRLADARTRAMGRKLQFDRWVRRCLATPAAVDAASMSARVIPGAFRRVLRYASDLG
jgi:flavin-dependent dehydrogenase